MQCQMLSLDLVLTAGIGQELRGVGNGRRTKQASKELSVFPRGAVHKQRRQLGGKWVKNWSKLQTDSTKNLPILKGGCQKVRKIDDVVYRWSPCLLLKCFVVSCLHRLDTLANNQRLLCATECTAILASVDECQSSSRHQHCLVIIITVPSNCVPTAAALRATAVVVI